MTQQRSIEIFSAGCSFCTDAEKLVRELSCSSCKIVVLDMQDPAIAARARKLGIAALPAVVIDGQLASCCSGRGVDKNTLIALGVGQPLSD